MRACGATVGGPYRKALAIREDTASKRALAALVAFIYSSCCTSCDMSPVEVADPRSFCIQVT